jgi:hypothetical protein
MPLLPLLLAGRLPEATHVKLFQDKPNAHHSQGRLFDGDAVPSRHHPPVQLCSSPQPHQCSRGRPCRQSGTRGPKRWLPCRPCPGSRTCPSTWSLPGPVAVGHMPHPPLGNPALPACVVAPQCQRCHVAAFGNKSNAVAVVRVWYFASRADGSVHNRQGVQAGQFKAE